MRSLVNKLLALLCCNFFLASITFAAPPSDKAQELYLQRQVEAAKTALMQEGPAFEINGILERDKQRRYLINGEEIIISSGTRILGGSLKEGQALHVVGKLQGNQKLAEEIIIQELQRGASSSEAMLGH
jgi:hypothetical protein